MTPTQEDAIIMAVIGDGEWVRLIVQHILQRDPTQYEALLLVNRVNRMLEPILAELKSP